MNSKNETKCSSCGGTHDVLFGGRYFLCVFCRDQYAQNPKEFQREMEEILAEQMKQRIEKKEEVSNE